MVVLRSLVLKPNTQTPKNIAWKPSTNASKLTQTHLPPSNASAPRTWLHQATPRQGPAVPSHPRPRASANLARSHGSWRTSRQLVTPGASSFVLGTFMSVIIYSKSFFWLLFGCFLKVLLLSGFVMFVFSGGLGARRFWVVDFGRSIVSCCFDVDGSGLGLRLLAIALDGLLWGLPSWEWSLRCICTCFWGPMVRTLTKAGGYNRKNKWNEDSSKKVVPWCFPITSMMKIQASSQVRILAGYLRPGLNHPPRHKRAPADFLVMSLALGWGSLRTLQLCSIS